MLDKNFITIAEYATRIGRDTSTVRQKCLRGNLPGAIKLGRDWLIPDDAPYPDKRIKTGNYKDWRNKSSD